MGKTAVIIGAAAAAVVAVVVVIACIFIFGGSSLPKYAPEDTEAIVFVNGNKIAKTKVFKAFQKTLAYENMVKEAKKDGVDIEKAIKGEACVFFKSAMMNGQPTAVVYNGDQAGAVFKLFQKQAEEKVANAKKRAADAKEQMEKDKKEAEEKGYTFHPEYYRIPAIPKLSTDKIDGKQAFVFNGEYENEAVIMLDKKTLQYSSSYKKSKMISEPLKKKGTDLTKAVDTSALISIAIKANEIPTKKMDDDQKKIAEDLEIVTVSLVESGSDLKIKVVGTYKSSDRAESAKSAIEKQLKEIVKEMKDSDDKQAKLVVDILKAIEVSKSGSKVTLSLKYSQDKIVKFIQDWDKEQREWRKEMEEREAERKQREAEYNK